MDLNSKMTALADEIRELSGTTVAKSIDEMTADVGAANDEVSSQSDLIAQLKDAANNLPDAGSGGSVSKKDVNFYDYDGTLLYSYTIKAAQALTELPELPSHEGLICQGWNWSLEDIKAHNCAINIGATYITDDGATRLYIHVGEKNTSVRLTIGLVGTAIIDWGDGTELVERKGSSINARCNTSHIYENAGEYTIKIMMDEGRIGFLGDSNGSWILNADSTSSSSNINHYYRKMLRKAELGSCVDYFGEYSLLNCCSLTSITIPNGVTSIDKYAFSHCYSLTSITIPNSVTSIGASAFKNCRSLVSIIIPNSVTSIGKGICYQCFSLTSITIPNGVTSIGEYAFHQCCSLTSIIIPNGATSIGKYAFYECYSLTSITIPNSVTSIGESAVSTCCSLTSITIPNGVTSIDKYAFSHCYSLTSITIPNSVTSIGASAFHSCFALTSITIPNGVTSIDNGIFRFCYSLTSITFSNDVTSIGASAFENCYSLTSITIPNGVTSIKQFTCYYCHSLTSIIIPNSVTTIEAKAFYGCYGIRYYDFSNHTTVPTLSHTDAFDGIFYNDCEIRVPSALYDEWIVATNWATYADRITAIPEEGGN